MLVNLHVKNFAIIDEIDVDFNEHLNILTGETGAGKSILVGSVNIALGARVSADMIRKGADYALVELVFYMDDPETIAKLKELDIFPEDNQLIISRKIMGNRSVNKINGENVSVATIRQVASLCIDIHGQHEHQSLLHPAKHLEIVDAFADKKLERYLEELKKIYKKYQEIQKKKEQVAIPKEEREHKISFLEFEKHAIEEASLQPDEEQELEEQYQKMKNSGAIVEQLSKVQELMSGENVSRAVREMTSVVELDRGLDSMFDQLIDIESLTGDFTRELADYVEELSFDERAFSQTEQRLDTIRTIYARYGGDYDAVMEHLAQVDEQLEEMTDYDSLIASLQAEEKEVYAEITKLATQITKVRKKSAGELQEKITQALLDLNFEQVRFEICVTSKEKIGANGADEIEFLISTNPGEEPKSLGKVASGGELSRIMLAVKSVMAEKDQIETLIFDEIDVGISGRTAQKVSEKMSVIGENHQVICITHLAQIAAMADTHYCIRKTASENDTKTTILPLTIDESVEELARILGGAQITSTVLENAREMRQLAQKTKKYTK